MELVKNRWSNFSIQLMEGVISSSAMVFVAGETVIPMVLSTLGADPFWITMSPILPLIGLSLGTPLTAGAIDRFAVQKKAVLICGIFQRIPYFLMAAFCFLITDGKVAGMLIGLCLLAYGIATGAAIAPWFRFLQKTVPHKLVGRLFALRFGISSVIGLGCGFLVSFLLNQVPGKNGFGLLFLLSSLLFISAMYFQYKVREPAATIRTGAGSATYGEILGKEEFKKLILVRIFQCAILIDLAYIPIHAKSALNLGESSAGLFTALVVVGAVAGNVCGGFLINKVGERQIMQWSLYSYLTVLVLCFFMFHIVLVLALFFLLGFSRDLWNTAQSTVMVNLFDARLIGRGTALMFMLLLPFLLLAGFIGSSIIKHFNSFYLLTAVSITLLLPALWAVRGLPQFAKNKGKKHGSTAA